MIKNKYKHLTKTISVLLINHNEHSHRATNQTN